ncbi:putative Ctr copper transporter [Rosa chinensis]|uniref:Copper transport protein n=1 Tax=Rosa chinensis TaxID=74649 RepID=A0A2P6QJC1_ROSCH|nr:copper transporter 1 [Rosa chinensis]PRQ34273.1 putative Ctr copper transporter [Rosa chinensis]
MEGMDHSHHDMGSMAPPPSMNGTTTMPHQKMMMHMTFFWGTTAEVLFSRWPGTKTGMYYVALLFVFALAVLVEWLSHCRIIKVGSGHVAAGLIQTLLHCLRVGLAYMVMLAVMSFNAGVFLVAVAGHTLGFLLFGSRVFRKPVEDEKGSDLPPMSC